MARPFVDSISARCHYQLKPIPIACQPLSGSCFLQAWFICGPVDEPMSLGLAEPLPARSARNHADPALASRWRTTGSGNSAGLTSRQWPPHRRRTTTPSRSFSSPEINLRAPVDPPWLEHSTLSVLLELPDGTSYQLAAIRPTGFYRDALRTYAGML